LSDLGTGEVCYYENRESLEVIDICLSTKVLIPISAGCIHEIGFSGEVDCCAWSLMRRFGLRRFRLCDWSVYYSGVRNAVLREAPEVRSDYFDELLC